MRERERERESHEKLFWLNCNACTMAAAWMRFAADELKQASCRTQFWGVWLRAESLDGSFFRKRDVTCLCPARNWSKIVARLHHMTKNIKSYS